jgi:DNA-binding response OmpR family regulator
MLHRILCVSYDDRLLVTRRMLLEREGYHVTTALGFKESCARCQAGGFDLLVLGHSIPHSHKQQLIIKFRKSSSAPILALWRPNERVMETATFLTFSDDPGEFLRAVSVILKKKIASAESVAEARFSTPT